MATAARCALSARRNEIRRWTLRFVGVDWSASTFRAQVRLYANAPGVPLLDLGTVTDANALGLRVIGVTTEGGAPVTTVAGLIDKDTMTDPTKLPYSGELGDDTRLAWQVQVDGVTRIVGDFWALASVIDSDNAPASYALASGASPAAPGSASAISLTIAGQDVIEVSIDGVEQLAPLVSAAQTAAVSATTVSAKLASAASLAGEVEDTFGGTIGDIAPALATDPGGGVNAGGVPGAMVRQTWTAPRAGYAATFRTLVGPAVAGRVVRFFTLSAAAVVKWVSPDVPADAAGLVELALTLADTPVLAAGDYFGVTSTGNPSGIQIFSSGATTHPDRQIWYNDTYTHPAVGDPIVVGAAGSNWQNLQTFFPLLDLNWVLPDVLATKPYIAAQAKPLRDRTIVINGDSISTPPGQGQPLDGGDTWPTLLEQITGATIVNHSLGSTAPNWDPTNPTVGLSATRAELTAHGLEPAFSYETQMLPYAADLWINTHGHNSIGRPVGSVDISRTPTSDVTAFMAGLDRTSFCGAQQYLIEQRLRAYPLGAIMLTTQTSLYAPYYATNGQTDALAKMAALRQATLALAAFYALPVIDFGREGQIGAARVPTLLAPDGLHPLSLWHAKYGVPLAVAEVLKVLRA